MCESATAVTAPARGQGPVRFFGGQEPCQTCVACSSIPCLAFQKQPNLEEGNVMRSKRQRSIAVRPSLAPLSLELSERALHVERVCQQSAILQLFRQRKIRVRLERQPRPRVRSASAQRPRDTASRFPSEDRQRAGRAPGCDGSSRARPTSADRNDRPTWRTRACAARGRRRARPPKCSSARANAACAAL